MSICTEDFVMDGEKQKQEEEKSKSFQWVLGDMVVYEEWWLLAEI